MNIVLVRYAKTDTHALVRVYANDVSDSTRVGLLSFTNAQWAELEKRNCTVYVGEKVS
jgi:hypothetical protein